MYENLIILLFIFILALALGIELISKIPSLLHTPLMSGTNAISGVTLVGAILLTGSEIAQTNTMVEIFGIVAVILSSINVIGGYFVTDRMLKMFNKKSKED